MRDRVQQRTDARDDTMGRNNRFASIAAVSALVLFGSNAAQAACTLPFQLTNGQPADASQVMANFNALAACLNTVAPGGAANAIQYNNGAGSLAGVGPLSNGQLLIGSTGNAPQAQTLTAGSGIQITNNPGTVTIAATGGASGAGLYRQVMSATPTSVGTGLTNWLNQGTSLVSDSAVGITIDAPSAGVNSNVVARYMPAPSPPYTITALIAATRNSNNFSGAGIGWYDGSNKLHVMSLTINNGAAARLEVEKWNTTTSFNNIDIASSTNAFSQPIWFRIQDDGTNVSFAFSQDGASFLPLFSVAKASSWLGTSGYNNVLFFSNPQGGRTLSTLMSWAQN
jgi:hypothetical protein